MSLDSNYFPLSTDNSDVIKEFRNLFLEKYLETNKIGLTRNRKSNRNTTYRSKNKLNYESNDEKIVSKPKDIPFKRQNSHGSTCANYRLSSKNRLDSDTIDNSQYGFSLDSAFDLNNKCNYINTEMKQDLPDRRTLSIPDTDNEKDEYYYPSGDNHLMPIFDLQICNINNMSYYMPPENSYKSGSSNSDFDDIFSGNISSYQQNTNFEEFINFKGKNLSFKTHQNYTSDKLISKDSQKFSCYDEKQNTGTIDSDYLSNWHSVDLDFELENTIKY
jgi:hypothetical protein